MVGQRWQTDSEMLPCLWLSWGRHPKPPSASTQWTPPSALCTQAPCLSLCRPSTPRTTRSWQNWPDSRWTSLMWREKNRDALTDVITCASCAASHGVSVPGDLSSQVGSLADGEATNRRGIFLTESSLFPLMYFSTLWERTLIILGQKWHYGQIPPGEATK